MNGKNHISLLFFRCSGNHRKDDISFKEESFAKWQQTIWSIHANISWNYAWLHGLAFISPTWNWSNFAIVWQLLKLRKVPGFSVANCKIRTNLELVKPCPGHCHLVDDQHNIVLASTVRPDWLPSNKSGHLAFDLPFFSTSKARLVTSNSGVDVVKVLPQTMGR